MFRWLIVVLSCLCLPMSLSACAGSSRVGNFSQFPGFAEYFNDHPRRNSVATQTEQVLLHKHRPRFFLPDGHVGLVDFYDDYIANGTLTTGDGTFRSDQVDSALLNQVKNDPAAVFVHQQRPGLARPTVTRVFARVDQAPVSVGQRPDRLFTFLSYHAVFRHSGIVAGVRWWQALALRLVGDLDDWHQLDNFTTATVVLNESLRPVALLLQQHNGAHTYVFGERVIGRNHQLSGGTSAESAVELAADERVVIDVAIRANELYPHQVGRRERPAVRFMNAKTLGYLMGLEPQPWTAAPDITDPHHEADYALAFLPADDAFYSFAGYLGARHAWSGREGPPGADYNTWPTLKPLGLQLLIGYWREGNAADFSRIANALRANPDPAWAARAQAAEFGATLARLGL